MKPTPAQELVDVIDDAGRTIGVVTRGEMRAHRLPHRCVYILVFNSRSDLFVHLRTETKDVYPGHWDVTIGGVLAAGEAFADGARRELEEELGIAARLELLFPYRYADAFTAVQAVVYRTAYEGPFRLQPEEVVRGEYVALSDLQERTKKDPFCPDGLAVLQEYRLRVLDKERAVIRCRASAWW